MRDLDRMIDEALGEEEREWLRRIGDEPGFFERALGMFGAGVKWMVALMMVIQALLFIAGFGQLRLPHFPVPDGHTVESWLRSECERGLKERYGEVTEPLQARLDYELDVIIRMGYAAYFLIVADFTRFARTQGIATTCRGSAPGSIVTYTLGITPVDPIAYELPFERFLNPDRVTMPDIDVDFEDARRDEVIRYVTQKYGSDHVAQIITFGTMLARAAIRDVGRVLGFGYGEVDRIAKAVPNQLGIKLDEALQTAPALREISLRLDGIAPQHLIRVN